jgi:hypothetical protein
MITVSARAILLRQMLVGLMMAATGVAISAAAEVAAMPPCEGPPSQPAYAPAGAPPNVQIWKNQSLADYAARASCVGWSTAKFHMLIVVAGTFAASDGVDTLLKRFGAVSTLLSVRYWSTTDQRWRPLVLSATALAGPNSSQTRADFTSAELESGNYVYLAQTDSRGAGEVIYRMRVRESKRGRFVLETENVTSIRWLALTLLKPGDLRSVYFIEERSPGIWSYYSLTRVEENGWLITGHENSYINRVVALYRHIAGIATDQEPPPAP